MSDIINKDNHIKKQQKNLRIALCLHGLSDGKNSKGRRIRSDWGYQCLKHEILDNNQYDVDVFLHSWSLNMKEQLKEWYQPKKYMIEEQKNYINKQDLRESMELIRDNYCRILNEKYTDKRMSEDGKQQKCMHCWKMMIISDLVDPYHRVCKFCYYQIKLYYRNMCSLYYSYWKCNELKKAYENENNFVYDLVITSRYDNWIGKICDLKTLSPEKFYYLKDDTKRKKPIDHLFISSSQRIDQFCLIYQRIPQYTDRLIVMGSANQYLNHDIIILWFQENLLNEEKGNLEKLEDRFPVGALSTMEPEDLKKYVKEKCPYLIVN